MNISSEVKSFVTYLNRNKHKVLTDAISIEKTDDDFSENADYYFEDVDSEKEDFLMEYFFKNMDELQEEEKELVKYG